MWDRRLKPAGALKQSLLEDYRGPLPSYITKEDAETFKATFLQNGLAAPTCWYKVITSGLQDEDDKRAYRPACRTIPALMKRLCLEIPPERYFPPKVCPVFYGAAKQDSLCLPQIGYDMMGDAGFKDHNVTIREFDADHWLILSKAEEVCEELEKWIEDTVTPATST